MNFLKVLYRVGTASSKNTAALNVLKQISVACYSVKHERRRPAKIYDADGETEIDEWGAPRRSCRKSLKKDSILGVIELDKNLATKNKALQYESSVEHESDNEKEDIIGTSYTRLGDTDKTFERRVLKVQSKKQRDKSNMIMLEGKRIIQDAITAGILPYEIFFTKASLVENLSMPPEEIKLYKMPYNKMKKWSPLDSPPGIIAFCKMPKNMPPQPKNAIPLTLICDNIREPGNMGTILRTVAGVGCSKVILTKGCVDIWDSKVLRSAAGAHFYIPIQSGFTWDEINKDLCKNTTIFIAHHNKENETVSGHTVPTVPYYSIDYSCLSNIVVVVGGETEGISDDAIQFARYRDGLKINVPLNCEIDSLNVGAAISTILFEIRRQFVIRNRDEVYVDDKNIFHQNKNEDKDVN